MPNGEGHRILTHAAFEALPEREKQWLSPAAERLEKEYCMFGDDYFKHPARIGPYIVLPDGRLPMDPWEIRHFRKDGPGKDYYTCGYYKPMRDSFEYFAAKCIECAAKENVDDFARFTGSLAHVVEDCGAPPHAVGTEMGTDMKFLKMLYPCADAGKMAGQFHAELESRYAPLTLRYTPVLLGTSPSEISFRMLERFTDMLENSISRILPLLDAYYSNDADRLAELLSECGRVSSEIMADFIYTTLAVGHNSIGGAEREALRTVSLGGLTPYERNAWSPFPYPYAEIRNAPWSLNDRGVPVPLSLLREGREIIFEKGFGLGPPSEMTYFLPGGVYSEFRAAVGIHSRLSSKTGMVFRVIGDRGILASAECGTVNDSREIRCGISGVKELTLKVELPGGSLWLSNSHAVWGDPELRKS